MTRLAILALFLLAGCSGPERIPPVVYEEAKALCKPFQGLTNAQIGTSMFDPSSYHISAECLGGQRVLLFVRINDKQEIQ
jgi:hypothetical protein